MLTSRRFSGLVAGGVAALLLAKPKADAQPVSSISGNAVSVTTSGTPTSRLLTQRFADIINVKDYGAVLDGTTFDGNAFEAAYNAAPNYGIINIPGGGFNALWTETPATKSVNWNILGTLTYGTGTLPVAYFPDGDLLTGYFGGRYNFDKTLTTSNNNYTNVAVNLINNNPNISNVSSCIIANGTNNASGFLWVHNASLNSAGNVNNQDVCYAASVYRNSFTKTWSYYGANADTTGLPGNNQSGTMVGFELDFLSNGLDSPDGGRAMFNMNALAYTPNVWTSGTAIASGGVVTAAPSGLYTYVATNSGTTGSTQPTWPTSTGTVTDNNITWMYGTTVATTVSTAMRIYTTNAMFGSALLTGAEYYSAIFDLSPATLIGSSGAALRMPANMAIDFNAVFAGAVNINTLLYSSGAAALQYQVSGSPVFSIGNTGSLTIGTSGPTITNGSAIPSSTQPIGSLYLRTSGSTGAHLYVSAGSGSWNSVSGV